MLFDPFLHFWICTHQTGATQTGSKIKINVGFFRKPGPNENFLKKVLGTDFENLWFFLPSPCELVEKRPNFRFTAQHTSQLTDEDPAVVANDLGIDVFVRLRDLRHSMHVHTTLVGERRKPCSRDSSAANTSLHRNTVLQVCPSTHAHVLVCMCFQDENYI